MDNCLAISLMHAVHAVLLMLVVIRSATVEAVTPPPYSAGNLSPFVYKGPDGELEDMEFRVAVDPGKTECFFQEAKKDHQLEVSYQVIDLSSRFGWIKPSGRDDLRVDFYLHNTQDAVIVSEQQKKDGSHVHTVTETGTYKLCFDNSYGYGTKLVNVEVYLYSTEDDDRWGYFEENYTFSPEVQVMESMESIRASINKVRDDMIRIQHAQNERQAVERRDRNIVEQNYEYVNRFSIMAIVLVTFVGALQVFLIRSLFEDKSILRKLLKGVKGY